MKEKEGGKFLFLTSTKGEQALNPLTSRERIGWRSKKKELPPEREKGDSIPPRRPVKKKKPSTTN